MKQKNKIKNERELHTLGSNGIIEIVVRGCGLRLAVKLTDWIDCALALMRLKASFLE